ncbi:MAG: TIGR03960 family B12-binding radical SAM protein, partial [Candidatus Omnitrophica bacterium]|nr:TIGR03960 family B12-binding radical SAM protein [Candidatus Omnitrophota bacterium]
KPGRYIGREWNISKKDFAAAEVKFALSFPDLYEVGMSNLGIRIIYGILNNIPEVACERFFSPAPDMEGALRSNNLEITSLESGRRLKEFDIVGFSLGYELTYTNVLTLLDLGAIPLQAALRGNEFPLVIGGGPCVLNPEPMHEFFDLFIIGEAEEVIPELIASYKKLKNNFRQNKMSKQELLVALSAIEGVYAPSLYEAVYDPEGKLEEFKPIVEGVSPVVRKRFVKDLDKAYFPSPWIVPYIQTIHDRLIIEIMRGCPNRCRFCQARAQYFPFRQRELNNVLGLASRAYQETGYEEISLCGLSVSDYPQIEQLMESLIGHFREKAVSVSLPSIKAKALVGNLSKLIATIKKTGLTFAPEAASERLRGIIGKDFNEEDFFNSLGNAYLSGYQHVKLYFMIGLPYEEEKDLDAIIDFSIRVSELSRKLTRRPAQVNISVNTLIPKPHTPLQWFAMQGLEEIKYKQDYLRSKTKNKRLKLDFHNRFMSVLEGVLSRGDRRLSQVILRAFKDGARFDAWNNYFVFDKWANAFDQSHIDYNSYLSQRPQEEVLPWSFLDTGIAGDYLSSEFKKIVAMK